MSGWIIKSNDNVLTQNNTFTGTNQFNSGIIIANGQAVKGTTTIGNTWLLQSYDVDNALYRTFGTFTNGNTPSCAFSQPSGGTLTWDGGTIGATTAVSTLRSLAGIGTGIVPSMGLLAVNTTPAANVTTGETDLMTYTIPTNSFSAAGKGIRITSWGTSTSNVNAKTVQTYFGGTSINSAALLINAVNVWKSVTTIFATGTDTQSYATETVRISATATDVAARAVGTLAIDDGAPIIIKSTGTATSTNDITQTQMLVEFFN